MQDDDGDGVGRHAAPCVIPLSGGCNRPRAVEETLKEREMVTQAAALDAAAIKEEYETLISDINALQRRAPR